MSKAEIKDFEHFLNQLIAVDVRPENQIDFFQQVGSGRKRTTIRKATVIPLAGASTTIKNLILGTLANAGVTVRGVLKQAPLLRSAIGQGAVGDCYLEAFMVNLALIAPTWLDDYVILPVNLADGTPGCVVHYYERSTNSIVQITTSLEVSTSYNNPHDDDIRPELIEKTYGFFRSGVADYLKLNMGSGTEAGIALGWTSVAARQPAEDPSKFISSHRSVGRAVMVLTSPSAKTLIYSHAYTGFDGLTLINPWDGSQNTPVTLVTLSNPAEVSAIYALQPSNTLEKLPVVIVPTNPVPDQPENNMITLDFMWPTNPPFAVDSSDPVNLVVTGPQGTAVPLAGKTNALSLIQTTDTNDAPISVGVINGQLAPNQYISRIPANPKKFIYTAATSGDYIKKTITLRAVGVDPIPTPTDPDPIIATFDLHKSLNLVKRSN